MNASLEQNTIKWLDRVDQIDPFFASPEELQVALNTAPTPELRAWLEGQIKDNAEFRAAMFPASGAVQNGA